MGVRGGSPAAVRSITRDFFFLYPSSIKLQSSADLLRNLHHLHALVLCCKCCLQNQVYKDRVCSCLNPQQSSQILWELASGKECSSYPECLSSTKYCVSVNSFDSLLCYASVILCDFQRYQCQLLFR